jgi:hypothetical protein
MDDGLHPTQIGHVKYAYFVDGLLSSSVGPYLNKSNFGTSSYAISASWAPGSTAATYTSSLFGTASWATNAVSASYAPGGSTVSSTYTTIATSSTNWITCSLSDTFEMVNITLGQLYSFTCSNLPTGNNYSKTSLFINNTATAQTCSLAFPANWTWIGTVPTYLTASKDGYISLESFGSNVVAVWGSQF